MIKPVGNETIAYHKFLQVTKRKNLSFGMNKFITFTEDNFTFTVFTSSAHPTYIFLDIVCYHYSQCLVCLLYKQLNKFPNTNITLEQLKDMFSYQNIDKLKTNEI